MKRAPATSLGIPPPTEAQREAIRQSWQYRVLIEAEAAELRTGGDDPLFRLLTAALALRSKTGPQYGNFGIISAEGFVLTNCMFDDGRPTVPAFYVCTVQELVDNLQRLAEACGLTENQQHGLFHKVRCWIKTDDREGAQNMRNDTVQGVAKGVTVH